MLAAVLEQAKAGGVLVATTDIRRARKITEALHEPSRGNRDSIQPGGEPAAVKWGR